MIKKQKFQIFKLVIVQVLLKIHKVPKRFSRKLYDKSGGPFVISEKGPNYTYKLIRVSNMRPLKSLINATNIRPYYDPDVHRADLSYNNQPDQPTTPLDSQPNDPSQQIALPPAPNHPVPKHKDANQFQIKLMFSNVL